jgi:hypothetical protein
MLHFSGVALICIMNIEDYKSNVLLLHQASQFSFLKIRKEMDRSVEYEAIYQICLD